MLELLGEVTAHVGDRPVDLGAPRQKSVLGALAVDAGRVVPVERLVERVWGPDATPRARATLHGYISRLRHALAEVEDVSIVRRSGGYLLQTSETDLSRFRALCVGARGLADAEQVRLLGDALVLWRGDALTGVDGEWAADTRERLAAERLAAERDLVDARLRLGHGEELVAELSERQATHPLDERLAGQYLLALHQAGRTADALEHYRRFRRLLVGELGTEPGVALQALHRRILEADPALIDTNTKGSAAVPRQLPAAPSVFVGREEELEALDAALHAGSGVVVISAIAGTGGIGKTQLALHWAHLHADHYPDGQLFVDLRGFCPDGVPTPPAAAVRGFLDALGIDTAAVPSGLDAQAALYRSTVARRRMLVVLDNAADVEQITPLLPGASSCTVLVTSRRKLNGLIVRHGARHVPLDPLTADESRGLLVRQLGAARVSAEPEAIDTLIALCDGFPLALAIIVCHVRTRPQLPLTAVAAELRELGLGALHDADPTASLPTVLSWSVRALTTRQREVFALLGIAPGADIGLMAAASLFDLSPAHTGQVLRQLEEASLLDQHSPGRWQMHDLVRAYATRLAPEGMTAALRRLLAHYTQTSRDAAGHLHPYRRNRSGVDPVAGVRCRPLGDVRSAIDWFTAEHRNLLTVQAAAADHGQHETVWQLAWATSTYHGRRGLAQDELAMWIAARTAATHLHAPVQRIQAERFLASAYTDLGWHEHAIRQLHEALELADRHGNLEQRALTYRVLARAYGQSGRNDDAFRYATDGLELFEALGDHAWLGASLNQVGWYASQLARYDVARTHCEAALQVHRRQGDTLAEASALDSLGFIEHSSGRHDRAIAHYRAAHVVFRELGDLYEAANNLDALGHPHIALGQHGEARAVWQEAVDLYRRQGRGDAATRLQRRLDELIAATPDYPQWTNGSTDPKIHNGRNSRT
ncbi:AfsR/SARP family transcriptional regulator [Lentzea alba]|uniref:AfsR/SARP family transcriptional regulator n=1 Tax=Lentzea alba TaxID=2714351 RepID=UPI0028BD38CA|nr:BTAD domain-containing putative transcriptional regulator [Lentzea alba]